jgi:3-oxoacyl-[acyl-carrier protein] reductase
VDLQLKGHRAIVTGSSAGIGEAIARKLAAEGAAVIVHGRRAPAVDAVVQAIGAEGGQAKGLVTFVASPLADYINGANLRIDGGSTAVV